MTALTAITAVLLAAAAYTAGWATGRRNKNHTDLIAQRLTNIDLRCATHTERLAAIESQLIKTGALPHPNPEEHQP